MDEPNHRRFWAILVDGDPWGIYKGHGSALVAYHHMKRVARRQLAEEGRTDTRMWELCRVQTVPEEKS